jgi:hypothetical protein
MLMWYVELLDRKSKPRFVGVRAIMSGGTIGCVGVVLMIRCSDDVSNREIVTSVLAWWTWSPEQWITNRLVVQLPWEVRSGGDWARNR